MSSMKDLLEKMDDKYPFAGGKAKPEQIPGDQVPGKEKFDMISPILGKKPKRHPAHGRVVGGGAAEEYEESVEHIADQLRKELEEYGALGSGISSGSSMDRTEYAQMRRDQKAQKQQVDAQEDNIEGQIKQLKAQMLAIKKSPQPVPVPGDSASLNQVRVMGNQRKAQIATLAQQVKKLQAQL